MNPMFNPSLTRIAPSNIELAYLAFRISFRETQERILLARQFSGTPREGFGYLTEVPFFKQVSPEVQLDLLARAWARFSSGETHPESLLEEAVAFAACERAIWCLGGENSHTIARYLRSGPISIAGRTRNEWQSLLWSFQLEVSPRADFLLIGEIADLAPDEAEFWRNDWGISSDQIDPLFEVLAEWRSSPRLYDRLAGLLTPREIEAVRNLLRA
jgi:hypothetical protein